MWNQFPSLDSIFGCQIMPMKDGHVPVLFFDAMRFMFCLAANNKICRIWGLSGKKVGFHMGHTQNPFVSKFAVVNELFQRFRPNSFEKRSTPWQALIRGKSELWKDNSWAEGLETSMIECGHVRFDVHDHDMSVLEDLLCLFANIYTSSSCEIMQNMELSGSEMCFGISSM